MVDKLKSNLGCVGGLGVAPRTSAIFDRAGMNINTDITVAINLMMKLGHEQR